MASKHNSKVSGLTPGTPAPVSGQYEKTGPRGGKGPEVTMPKGHNLPPAAPGTTYTLVDRTKHKR